MEQVEEASSCTTASLQHLVAHPAIVEVEGRVAGRSRAKLYRNRIEHAYPDPASEYLVVQTVQTTEHSELRVDLGAGRFESPHIPKVHLLAPPDVDCDFDGRGPFELQMIALPKRFVNVFRDERATRGTGGSDFGPLHSAAFVDPAVDRLISMLWREADHGNPRGELFAEHLLLSLVLALERRSEGPSTLAGSAGRFAQRRLKRVEDYLRAHVARPIDLSDVAEAVQMNRFELSRAFRATMGQSLWQYFIALRCERAAELLAQDDEAMPLSYVAVESGFHDQSHLHRHFRRNFGITPGRYRACL